MKILKVFALVVGIAVVLLLGIAAVTKKEYSVARDATINLPKDKVFAYLVQLKNQGQFQRLGQHG
jgi:mannitol/fructose-specific phosphotransferase system IIA component